MLYVSRFAGRYCYGVVDTDDGIEEVVAGYDVINAVSNLGVTILGTVIDPGSSNTPVVNAILPYNIVESMTPLQVKTNLLQHVEVFTFGDMVTNIRFRADEITVPPVIRVSDFGKVCGDRMLYGNRPAGAHKITLILDDNLIFSKHTFIPPIGSLGVNGFGVVFDLREIRSAISIKSVYSALIKGKGQLEMLDSIIDDQARKDYMAKSILGHKE